MFVYNTAYEQSLLDSHGLTIKSYDIQLKHNRKKRHNIAIIHEVLTLLQQWLLYQKVISLYKSYVLMRYILSELNIDYDIPLQLLITKVVVKIIFILRL